MILEVLQTLETAINSDNQIKSLVSQYKGKVALFSNLAPQDVSEPYIVVHFDIDSMSEISDAFDYNVEILDHKATPFTVIKIAERIEYIFNHLKSSYISKIKRENGGLTVGENSESQHYHLGFTVKVLRSDLF